MFIVVGKDPVHVDRFREEAEAAAERFRDSKESWRDDLAGDPPLGSRGSADTTRLSFIGHGSITSGVHSFGVGAEDSPGGYTAREFYELLKAKQAGGQLPNSVTILDFVGCNIGLSHPPAKSWGDSLLELIRTDSTLNHITTLNFARHNDTDKKAAQLITYVPFALSSAPYSAYLFSHSHNEARVANRDKIAFFENALKDLRSLQTRAEAYVVAIATTRSEITALEAGIDQRRAQITEAFRNGTSTQGSLLHLHHEISDLQAQLVEKRTALADLDVRHQATLRRIENIGEKATLRTDLARRESEIADVSTQISSCEARIASLNAEVVGLKGAVRLSPTGEGFAELQARIRELRTTEAEMNTLKNRLFALNKDKKELQIKIQALNDESSINTYLAQLYRTREDLVRLASPLDVTRLNLRNAREFCEYAHANPQVTHEHGSGATAHHSDFHEAGTHPSLEKQSHSDYDPSSFAKSTPPAAEGEQTDDQSETFS